MSTIGERRETWLKRECIDAGLKLVDLQSMPQSIFDFLLEGNYQLVDYMLEQFKTELTSKLTSLDAKAFYNRAMDMVSKHKSKNIEGSLSDIGILSDDLREIMFEKVAECQCGRK